MDTDQIDSALEEFFPRPLHSFLDFFKSEFRAGIRRLIQRLDLVTRDEFLVQQRLLEEAYQEIERMKERDGK